MDKIKIITLCSGYDSQCLALERLKSDIPFFDYELVAWAEYDPESNKPLNKQPAVIAHNVLFPDSENRNLGDITKVDWFDVPDCDVLFYSTPCQSISSMGLQHGLSENSGTRSSIIWDVFYAIAVKKPKYLIMENVKAIKSEKFANDYNAWKRKLSQLGYCNFDAVLNSKDFGVPQNRQRVFLVSILGEGVHFSFPTPERVADRLDDIIDDEVQEKFYISSKLTGGVRLQDMIDSGIIDRPYTWIDTYNKSVHNIASTIRANASTNCFFVTDKSTRVRKPTPTEYFRLMGVSEIDINKLVNSGISQTELIKLAGNSIVVNVLYYLFMKLLMPNEYNLQKLLYG